MVQVLIQETGPAVRKSSSHCTLLHTAAANNQLEMVLFLLGFIHPNVVNKDLQTPAHLAAMNGHLQVLKILLADEEMNPSKKDIYQRTYKELVSPIVLFNFIYIQVVEFYILSFSIMLRNNVINEINTFSSTALCTIIQSCLVVE